LDNFSFQVFDPWLARLPRNPHRSPHSRLLSFYDLWTIRHFYDSFWHWTILVTNSWGVYFLLVFPSLLHFHGWCNVKRCISLFLALSVDIPGLYFLLPTSQGPTLRIPLLHPSNYSSRHSPYQYSRHSFCSTTLRCDYADYTVIGFL